MNEELTLRLFYDKSNVVRPGQRSAIRWGVLNPPGQPTIRSLEISLSCGCSVVLEEGSSCYLPDGKLIRSGICEIIGHNLLVRKKTNSLSVDIKVEATMDGEIRLAMVSQHPFSFPLNLPNTGSIEVESDQPAIIKGLDSTCGKIRVQARGGGIIEFCQPVTPVMSGKHLNPDGTDTSFDTIEISLIHRAASSCDSKSPDLENFDNCWPGKRELRLEFVDQKGRPRHGKSQVGWYYALRVEAQESGFLTLLTGDRSGKHYLLAPHANLDPDAFRLTPGAVRLFPGDLLRMPLPGKTEPSLCFMDHGLDLVLALLTPEPLVRTPASFNLNACYPVAEVGRLLRAATAVAGKASVALARIEVE